MSGKVIDLDSRGFTLIEAVMAVFVLTVGILTLYSMQIASIQGNATAMGLTSASTWSGARIERLLGLPYSDSAFDDIDKDGGDSAKEYGLNDTGARGDVDAADGIDASPDGKYQIFWNIADNQLFRNLKTVRVIVRYQDRSIQKQVVMDYIKANM